MPMLKSKEFWIGFVVAYLVASFFPLTKFTGKKSAG
jgi:hypothetical protein